jgi:hypothetical protein
VGPKLPQYHRELNGCYAKKKNGHRFCRKKYTDTHSKRNQQFWGNSAFNSLLSQASAPAGIAAVSLMWTVEAAKVAAVAVAPLPGQSCAVPRTANGREAAEHCFAEFPSFPLWHGSNWFKVWFKVWEVLGKLI